MIYILHFSFSFIATMAFGILTNVPRRALLSCGLTGSVGWLAYWLLAGSGMSIGFANFVGAVAIGILSIFFSRKLRMPLIIFNIPSLVPLVPGGPAYTAVRDIMLGNHEAGVENILIVVTTAGAIAIGFMVTSVLEKLVLNYRRMKQAK